jgi:hypothetical protein
MLLLNVFLPIFIIPLTPKAEIVGLLIKIIFYDETHLSFSFSLSHSLSLSVALSLYLGI